MSIYVKREIADYIIDTLRDTSGLHDIAVFIRGALPSTMIPQDKYPFCEVIVADENEDPTQPEMSGNYYAQVYGGIITVTVLLTELSPGDWLEVRGNRKAVVPSYDLVEEYLQAIVYELQKCEHKGLIDLTIGDEVVTAFTVSGPRIYGVDREARTNSWENYGVVPFVVKTTRRGG